MDKMFYKRYFSFIYLMLLCIPLFFINIRDSHDWGDDFSQYIHQAINITKGIPQSETGVIDDGDGPGVHITMRPMGFPLMLAPVCFLFGNNITAFSFLITILLFLLCLVLFFFYNKRFNPLGSIFLVLIFAYNPFTLNFKMEIMSDIPFTLLLILTIIIYSTESRNKLIKYISTGILLGVLISTRTIGVTLLAAIFVDELKNMFIHRKKVDEKVEIAKRFSFIITIVVAINIANVSKAYFEVISLHDFIGTIASKFSYYLLMFRYYFMSGSGKIPLLATITQWMMVGFVVIGFVKKYIKKVDFIDIFVFIYFISLLQYPDMHSGMRFLFPVFPLLLYYAANGLMIMKIDSHINRSIFSAAFGLFILFPYTFSIANIIKHQNETLIGPQEKEAVEAFDFIKMNTPDWAIIAFNKPRALALYTGRKTYQFAKESPYEMGDRFKMFEGIYLLTCIESPDTAMNAALFHHQDQVELVWMNSRFKLLRLKRTSLHLHPNLISKSH